MSERTFLTLDEASAMLPDGKEVHTFRSAVPAIIGCNISRNSLLKIMKEWEGSLELAGDQATAMGHGLVLTDDQGPMFIETQRVEQS